MDRYRLVTTTKEYSVVAAFADKYRIKDENEIVNFAVQIQISKVHNRVYEDIGNLELLRDAGTHMLERFESISCTAGRKGGIFGNPLSAHEACRVPDLVWISCGTGYHGHDTAKIPVSS